MMKKTGKLREFVDFRDLNVATPKEIYVMPITDMLVDFVANMNFFSLWMVSLVIIRF